MAKKIIVFGSIMILLVISFLWVRMRCLYHRAAPQGQANIEQSNDLKYADETNNLTNIDETNSQMLQALGYVHWTDFESEEESSKSGVTRYSKNLSFPGINLYKSSQRAYAELIDMQGHALHRWVDPKNPPQGWHHVKMTQNGDLFAIIKNYSLVKLDWNSNLLWRMELKAHHDLAIDGDQNVYVLTHDFRDFECSSGVVPIIDDNIVILSNEGEFLNEVPLSSLFGHLIPVEKLGLIKNRIEEDPTLTTQFTRVLDVFHCNSIEILERDIPGIGKANDLLICFRYLDLIATIDILEPRVVWSWGKDILDHPHNPTILDNDNILVFDNGPRRGWSRIIELNPSTGKIVWEYRGNQQEPFFSKTRGSCQLLPNGNVLIAESDRGRVFEIKRTGEIVWEFYNPEVRDDNKARATIYRMLRLGFDFSPRFREIMNH